MKRIDIINQIIKERPEAVLVSNKYKVLIGVIKRMYPEQFEKIPLKIWEDIAFDLINGDRDWRKATQGFDEENKQRLEDNWIKENYGTIPK